MRLLEGGGERAELELVAREIRALLEDGMAPEEIAVVLRAPGSAADLVEEVFSSAKIPYALQRRRPFADTAIGRALIGLLRCLTPDGQAGDLLAWLRAPGLLEHPELADRLEARARRTGASSAAQARALWEEKHWRLETIDHLREAANRGPGALIERAGRELQWLFCAPRRGRASVLGSDELDEARALAAGRRALGELRELARVAPELAPGDAGGLAKVLEGVELVSGERPARRGRWRCSTRWRCARGACGRCSCAACRRACFRRPRGRSRSWPRRRARRIWSAPGGDSGLRLGEHEDALAAERYLLYAAVSRPEELLVLSWHAADDDGEPGMPSLFVDDVCDLFEESLRRGSVRRPLGAVGWPTAGDPMRPRPRAGR